MKIAVIGAGAIGNLTAGYLKFKNADIYLVGRKDSIAAIKNNGLDIVGTRGNIHVKIDCYEHLKEKPDLAILAVITQDLEKAIKDNLAFLKEAVVVTTKNGLQEEYIAAKYIPAENIVSSIVMFGATYLKPSQVVHNFEGPWIIGDFSGASRKKLDVVSPVLKKAFAVVIGDNIKGMKYLKIFLNANNCIPAILGVSMQEAFADLELSRVSIAIWKEAFDIVTKAGIELMSLPDFTLERLKELITMPSKQSAQIFSGIMRNLSIEPLYGSILQSINRNRPSEINYINGEFVRLAKQNKLSCPLNEKLVKLVHKVETTKEFLTKEKLFAETKALVDVK